MPDEFQSIEVKFAFDPAETTKAFADLAKFGLTTPAPLIREICFFDLPEAPLFASVEQQLIVRTRRTVAGTKEDDAIVKLRGIAAVAKASKFPSAEFEGDQNVGEVPKPSLSVKGLQGSIKAALAGEVDLASLLEPAAKDLFREITTLPLSSLQVFGPIRAQVWKLEIADLGKITVELWEAGTKTFLELSDDKDSQKKADKFQAALAKFVSDNTQAKQLQGSKTRFALEATSPPKPIPVLV